MKRVLLKILFCCFAFLLVTGFAKAQTTISGTITDAETGEALIGVSVAIQGTVTGTVTDAGGNFSLATRTAPPFQLVFSSVGYQGQSLEITDSQSNISVQLASQTIAGQEVVVSASRVEESILESPVTIEKMDINAIRNSASANFYDALANIKGVDMATQSITFSSPNTRGFGATGNTRMLQLIDGIDNQAPGLNFAPGNLVGIPELDVESLELLPGASSVLYGPGAINGTLLMNSKSPFLYQGLSVNAKVGANHFNEENVDVNPYYDLSLRYAKAFNNKFAFKINLAYFQAYDWNAEDYRSKTIGASGIQTGIDQSTRTSNSAYDGINIFGDEAATTFSGVSTGALNGRRVSRTGYFEKDLVDYNARSIKANVALHYKLTENIEAIVQGAFGYGTTVYSANDRYNIRNFSNYSGKVELRGSNFFVRGYTNQERSGDSFAAAFTALGIQRTAKADALWFQDYAFAFNGAFAGAGVLPFSDAEARRFADSNLSNTTANPNPLIAGTINALTGGTGVAARANTLARLEPGSQAFNDAAERIKKTSIANPSGQGSQFLDATNLYHVEGMYNFNKIIDPKAIEIIVGAHYRSYELSSAGTIFDDLDRKISIWEAGGYVQLTKKLINDRLKISAAGRFDKNQNFEARFTPRVSMVYSAGANRQHNFRLAYQTGFRNPTTQNQFINLNVGPAQLIGGLPEFQTKFNLINNAVTADAAGITSFLTSGGTAKYQFKEFRPEFVQTFEAGYKALLWNRLFVDGYAYYSQYENFIGSVNLISTAVVGNTLTAANFPGGVPTNTFTYSVPVNSTTNLQSFGWGIGADYKFNGGYILGGNVALNKLGDLPSDTPTSFQTFFNSPDYRTNMSFGNRNIGNSNIGFNFTWR